MPVTGNRGRFSDRIKKILFRRRRKNSNNEKDTNNIYANYLKVIAVIPALVYDNVIPHEKQNDSHTSIEERSKLILRRRNLVNNIDVNEIKNKQAKIYGVSDTILTNKDDLEVNNQNVNETLEVNNRVKELEKGIINLIKKDLIKMVNEMEILQSELYILSEVNGENISLKKCQEELDNIKNMICKIDKLKEEYDFLKDNYDFEYLLELDNPHLVDRIIELRDTFGNNEVKAVSRDYKLLDIYKSMYLKIDDLRDKMIEFENTRQEEEKKLKERDIDFEKLKQDVYNVDIVNRNYDGFVRNQNELLKELDEKIAKITSQEVSEYHLKGFGELFKNTFKYFGLLMVSPLKGIIPSIATETLITGNLIKNLYKNLEWEENKRLEYYAIDYSSMINVAINDLVSTGNIVDKTLDDIVHLKIDYNEKFEKYDADFLEYHEIMNKITDMENKILGNKIKIEIMRKRAYDQMKNNDDTLIRVREMNEKARKEAN